MHCTNGPVEFHGYSLPADTIVIPNTYAIHMDPKEWRNPEEFDPNRFLNSEGQFVKHKSFMPFSIGKINNYCYIYFKFHSIYISKILFTMLTLWSM